MRQVAHSPLWYGAAGKPGASHSLNPCFLHYQISLKVQTRLVQTLSYFSILLMTG